MEEELETPLGPTRSDTGNANRAMRESFSEVISIPSSASIFSISSGELAQPMSLLSSCSSDPSMQENRMRTELSPGEEFRFPVIPRLFPTTDASSSISAPLFSTYPSSPPLQGDYTVPNPQNVQPFSHPFQQIQFGDNGPYCPICREPVQWKPNLLTYNCNCGAQLINPNSY